MLTLYSAFPVRNTRSRVEAGYTAWRGRPTAADGSRESIWAAAVLRNMIVCSRSMARMPSSRASRMSSRWWKRRAKASGS